MSRSYTWATMRSRVTVRPGRSALGYGPASVTMLSPPAATTRTGIGGWLGSFMTQFEPSGVRNRLDVRRTLSLLAGVVCTRHMVHLLAAIWAWTLPEAAKTTIDNRTARFKTFSLFKGGRT